MKTNLIIIIVGIFIGGCQSFSQPKPITQETSVKINVSPTGELSTKEYTFYHDLLKRHFETQLLNRGFNGGILIAKNGVIVYEDYKGFRDLRLKDSMTANTPMHIASASKTFTGMAVLQLVQQGKITLDDSLGKFFPNFPYTGITVKTLLNHRSGLPNYTHYLENMKWDKKKSVTNADVLNSLYTMRPNKESFPDRRFSYSNTNYVLLALIVEKVVGESFPSYIKRTIFDSLLMHDTWIATPADSMRITPSFDGRGRYWQTDFLDLTYGDKNVYSTPRDLLKWEIAVSSGQIINKEMQDLAYTAYSNERPSTHNYGLGWRLLKMPDNKKVIYHNGRWHGTNAAFARLTDEKATIIVIGNKYNSNIYASAKKAYAIFGGYVPADGEEDEDKLTKNSKSDKAAESIADLSVSDLGGGKN